MFNNVLLWYITVLPVLFTNSDWKLTVDATMNCFQSFLDKINQTTDYEKALLCPQFSLLKGDKGDTGNRGLDGKAGITPNCESNFCKINSSLLQLKGYQGESGHINGCRESCRTKKHIVNKNFSSMESQIEVILENLVIKMLQDKNPNSRTPLHQQSTVQNKVYLSNKNTIYRMFDRMASRKNAYFYLPPNQKRIRDLVYKQTFQKKSTNNFKRWLTVGLELGTEIRLPLKKDIKADFYEKRNKNTSKIFITNYPQRVTGGAFRSIEQANQVCGDSGIKNLRTEGFRVLLTSKFNSLLNLVPNNMFHLPVVNLAGKELAASWKDFIDGQLSINENRIYAMNGKLDEATARWSWKYYWLGKNGENSCLDWKSNNLEHVASVLAFNYQNHSIENDIASCFSNLYLMCFKVSNEERFLHL